MSPPRCRWLLLLVQLPASPSSRRVALWRRLRSAGATSLLNGSWVLPFADAHAELFKELADGVREAGGTAAVFEATTTPEEDVEIKAGFQRDRTREYEELSTRVRAYLDEIERETRLKKFTFAEFEEIEDDYEKLAAWLAKIAARDFFPNDRHRQADHELTACNGARAAFCDRVFQNEALPTTHHDEGNG